jgi:predicted permease
MVTADLLAIGFANTVFIGLKAFQQLNVVHGEKFMVFVTSHLMALAEVFLVAQYATYGAVWPLILTVGTSAGIGSVGAILLRQKFFRHNVL